jgi:hypothetical protein
LRSVFAKSISWRSLHIFQILTPCGFRAAVAGALEVVQALLEAWLCEKGWVLVSGESFHLGTFFYFLGFSSKICGFSWVFIGGFRGLYS